jgi:hypothetical protein
LAKPFEFGEVYTVLASGSNRRALGIDSLGHEFYLYHWALLREVLHAVLNQMFWKGKTTQLQKRGVIIFLSKERVPQSPEDFRTITLLNNDYKIFFFLLTNRLQTVITEHLPGTQFCSVQGNTILDAVASIRDPIAYAEYHCTPLCVIALDFHNAFDRISHDYLFKTYEHMESTNP